MDPSHFPSRGFPSIPPRYPPLQPPPPSDLPAAISHLKSLLSFASSTLSSLPLPFPSPPLHSPLLIPCPYNPHHLLPPESLYRHFLKCPSPLPSLPSLPPPNTKPVNEIQQSQTSFPPTCSASDSDTDFIYTRDSEIGDLGSAFLYKDCPAVVTSVTEPAKSFTLPGFLLSECGVLTTTENDTISGKFLTVLPSEYWLLRSEVEAWQSFPISHSYTALRAILGFITVSEGDLKKWVISNSPRYGIVIDVTVRDHIWFLLKVCLKAVRREALCYLDTFLRNDGVFNPKFMISCPKLSRSFAWLSNQLSILYGEICARSFSLGMIKKAIVRSGFCMMSKFAERGEETDNRESDEVAKEGACNGNVLVSQIACAIGALHQRAFLEENIRALRSTQPVPKPHLLMEYAYMSSRAADERSKRPNYRPILDYDSLPSNRGQNQEGGRTKSKEELLAEERDYKRRRTSYRGKKAKRSPTEILRDIIEEHMEVIKQAEGLGSHQTSTEYASSKPDNSQKSTASDNSPFHNSPSPSHYKSHKRGSRYEREDDAGTGYSRSYKEHDDRHTGPANRKNDADCYASRSYSEHEDRYRSKERGRDHHNRGSESVFQDPFDERYDAYRDRDRDREEKRRNHRCDRSR